MVCVPRCRRRRFCGADPRSCGVGRVGACLGHARCRRGSVVVCRGCAPGLSRPPPRVTRTLCPPARGGRSPIARWCARTRKVRSSHAPTPNSTPHATPLRRCADYALPTCGYVIQAIARPWMLPLERLTVQCSLPRVRRCLVTGCARRRRHGASPRQSRSLVRVPMAPRGGGR